MRLRDLLREFVDGGLAPAALIEGMLADEAVAAALIQRRPPSWAHTMGSSYELFASMDPGDSFAVAGAKDHAREILETMGVSMQRDPVENELLATMSKLQPRWVDVPNDLLKTWIEDAGARRGKALKAFVDARIDSHFRCAGKRPRWLQEPRWQYDAERAPMVFVGQLDLGDLRHDESAVYVFAGAAGNEIKWVIQSA